MIKVICEQSPTGWKGINDGDFNPNYPDFHVYYCEESLQGDEIIWPDESFDRGVEVPSPGELLEEDD